LENKGKVIRLNFLKKVFTFPLFYLIIYVNFIKNSDEESSFKKTFAASSGW